jgi:hypothetical protein
MRTLRWSVFYTQCIASLLASLSILNSVRPTNFRPRMWCGVLCTCCVCEWNGLARTCVAPLKDSRYREAPITLSRLDSCAITSSNTLTFIHIEPDSFLFNVPGGGGWAAWHRSRTESPVHSYPCTCDDLPCLCTRHLCVA